MKDKKIDYCGKGIYEQIKNIKPTEATQFSIKDFEEDLYRCRVKYLSAEDIVDLGFFKIKEEPNKFDIILGTKFTLNDYNLYLSDVTGRVIVTANDLTRAYDYGIGPKEYTLFNGKIKNKSKLKEVLQMVGVL